MLIYGTREIIRIGLWREERIPESFYHYLSCKSENVWICLLEGKGMGGVCHKCHLCIHWHFADV